MKEVKIPKKLLLPVFEEAIKDEFNKIMSSDAVKIEEIKWTKEGLTVLVLD